MSELYLARARRLRRQIAAAAYTDLIADTFDILNRTGAHTRHRRIIRRRHGSRWVVCSCGRQFQLKANPTEKETAR